MYRTEWRASQKSLGSGVGVDVARLAIGEPGRVGIDGHADYVGIVGLPHRQIRVQRLIGDILGRRKCDQIGVVANVGRHRVGEVGLETDARVRHDTRGVLVGLMINFDVLGVLDWLLLLYFEEQEANNDHENEDSADAKRDTDAD